MWKPDVADDFDFSDDDFFSSIEADIKASKTLTSTQLQENNSSRNQSSECEQNHGRQENKLRKTNFLSKFAFVSPRSGNVTDTEDKPAANHVNIGNQAKSLKVIDVSSVSVIEALPENKTGHNVENKNVKTRGKKRKFPGPAGVFADSPKQLDSDKSSKEIKEFKSAECTVKEFSLSQTIVGSQTQQELHSLPWQNMLKEVSCDPDLSKAMKLHTLKSVLLESSKKSLPKHVLVPVMCVLLKSVEHDEKSLMVLFKDETDEIGGNISEEVMEKHKNIFQVGNVFILKQVDFLCNTLMLKLENLVSVFGEDGVNVHMQNWHCTADENSLKPKDSSSSSNSKSICEDDHNIVGNNEKEAASLKEHENIVENVEHSNNMGDFGDDFDDFGDEEFDIF